MYIYIYIPTYIHTYIYIYSDLVSSTYRPPRLLRPRAASLRRSAPYAPQGISRIVVGHTTPKISLGQGDPNTRFPSQAASSEMTHDPPPQDIFRSG